MEYVFKVGDKVTVMSGSTLYLDHPSINEMTEVFIHQIDRNDDELPYELSFQVDGGTRTQWSYEKELKHFNAIRIGGE